MNDHPLVPVINSGNVIVCEHLPEEGVYALILKDTRHIDLSASGPMKDAPGSSMYVFSHASRFQIHIPEDKFEDAMRAAGISTTDMIKNVTFITAEGRSYEDVLKDPDSNVITFSINDEPALLN